MATYRIAKWKETFETAKTREYKSISWVSLPVGFSSNGYHELIEEFEGDAPIIYGAWCALLSVAALAPVRGTLASSNGRPYSISRIAAETRMPHEAFERLFAWALNASVGWLEEVKESEAPATDPPRPDESPVGALDNGRNVDNQELDNGRNGHPSPSVREVRPLNVGEIWKDFEAKAKQLASKIEPNARRLGDNFEACLKFAAFPEVHQEISGAFEDVIKQVHDKVRRGKPPDRPWGYLKTGYIRICKQYLLDFDKQWAAISIPDEILKRSEVPR